MPNSVGGHVSGCGGQVQEDLASHRHMTEETFTSALVPRCSISWQRKRNPQLCRYIIISCLSHRPPFQSSLLPLFNSVHIDLACASNCGH